MRGRRRYGEKQHNPGTCNPGTDVEFLYEGSSAARAYDSLHCKQKSDYASLHTRSGRCSRHASPWFTGVSPLNRCVWGVCP